MLDPLKIPGSSIRPPEVTPKSIPPVRGAAPGETGKSFQEMLSNAVTQVERLQTEADSTIKQLVAGEITDVAEAMVAVEKADVSFRTMMTVRNKVLMAYEEIMRMQI